MSTLDPFSSKDTTLLPEDTSGLIVHRNVIGQYIPDMPWTNLLGFVLLIIILIAVVWILILIVNHFYAVMVDCDKQIYHNRHRETF